MFRASDDRLPASDPAAIVAGYEARARRFETPCGEGSLVWHSWGSGPPLLLVHGSHGGWSHWIRSIDALAGERTLWVPDLPGHGLSAVPAAPSHEAISGALVAGLRTLTGADLPIDIIGFSFGGVPAAHLAALHPDAVRRLILVGTGGMNTPMRMPELRRVRGLGGEARDAALRHNLLELMIHDPAKVDALAIHLQLTNGLRARIEARPLVQPNQLLTALPKISAQIDAIWGEHDRPHFDPAVQEAVLRRFAPDMEFHIIPDSGHWAMYENAEAFSATALAMVRRPLRQG